MLKLSSGVCFVLAAGFSLVVPSHAVAAVKDACTVFSAADAQAALGEPVGPGKSEDRASGVGDGSACRYKSTIGKAFSAKSVSLTVQYSTTDMTGSAGGIADNLKSAGFQNAHQISGIGSGAVWGTNSAMGRSQGELTVIKNKSTMVIVLITGIADEASALDRAKAIAVKALPLT